jgi:hypothetical protein
MKIINVTPTSDLNTVIGQLQEAGVPKPRIDSFISQAVENNKFTGTFSINTEDKGIRLITPVENEKPGLISKMTDKVKKLYDDARRQALSEVFQNTQKFEFSSGPVQATLVPVEEIDEPLAKNPEYLAVRLTIKGERAQPIGTHLKANGSVVVEKIYFHKVLKPTADDLNDAVDRNRRVINFGKKIAKDLIAQAKVIVAADPRKAKAIAREPKGTQYRASAILSGQVPFSATDGDNRTAFTAKGFVSVACTARKGPGYTVAVKIDKSAHGTLGGSLAIPYINAGANRAVTTDRSWSLPLDFDQESHCKAFDDYMDHFPWPDFKKLEDLHVGTYSGKVVHSFSGNFGAGVPVYSAAGVGVTVGVKGSASSSQQATTKIAADFAGKDEGEYFLKGREHAKEIMEKLARLDPETYSIATDGTQVGGIMAGEQLKSLWGKLSVGYNNQWVKFGGSIGANVSVEDGDRGIFNITYKDGLAHASLTKTNIHALTKDLTVHAGVDLGSTLQPAEIERYILELAGATLDDVKEMGGTIGERLNLGGRIDDLVESISSDTHAKAVEYIKKYLTLDAHAQDIARESRHESYGAVFNPKYANDLDAMLNLAAGKPTKALAQGNIKYQNYTTQTDDIEKLTASLFGLSFAYDDKITLKFVEKIERVAGTDPETVIEGGGTIMKDKLGNIITRHKDGSKTIITPEGETITLNAKELLVEQGITGRDGKAYTVKTAQQLGQARVGGAETDLNQNKISFYEDFELTVKTIWVSRQDAQGTDEMFTVGKLKFHDDNSVGMEMNVLKAFPEIFSMVVSRNKITKDNSKWYDSLSSPISGGDSHGPIDGEIVLAFNAEAHKNLALADPDAGGKIYVAHASRELGHASTVVASIEDAVAATIENELAGQPGTDVAMAKAAWESVKDERVAGARVMQALKEIADDWSQNSTQSKKKILARYHALRSEAGLDYFPIDNVGIAAFLESFHAGRLLDAYDGKPGQPDPNRQWAYKSLTGRSIDQDKAIIEVRDMIVGWLKSSEMVALREQLEAGKPVDFDIIKDVFKGPLKDAYEKSKLGRLAISNFQNVLVGAGWAMAATLAGTGNVTGSIRVTSSDDDGKAIDFAAHTTNFSKKAVEAMLPKDLQRMVDASVFEVKKGL